ncbi:hypothetical protein RvVAR0630_17980 [Agrobacterium vitis]|uniref:hypothetical protein n=1 Tax=Agrobacterium vitis TaxID=373 RepID=UPI0015D6F6B5|nr:hypothetical protein [Agrobacterium vitis]BCH59174.1 hypothetical protein RvVAR0630_17980 [Agrobacterium vitis]
MNWADYQPGRRVVCVDDLDRLKRFYTRVPQKGKVYTIRSAEIGEGLTGEMFSLTFTELASYGIPGRRFQPSGVEWMFDAKSFKPLDERRLDQFRHMLTKKPAHLSDAGVGE